MKPLDSEERQLAEATARVIVKAEEIGLPDASDKLGVTPHAFRLLARAHVALCDQVRALHDLVDMTDPTNAIAIAIAKIDLARRPPEWTEPRLVQTPEQIIAMSTDDLLAIYCRVMNDVAEVFVKYENYVVRQWDGMDGCWTDCTGEVGREVALRAWAERTDGGTRRVAYAEIDYCRIFPGGTRMFWDGANSQEMYR